MPTLNVSEIERAVTEPKMGDRQRYLDMPFLVRCPAASRPEAAARIFVATRSNVSGDPCATREGSIRTIDPTAHPAKQGHGNQRQKSLFARTNTMKGRA